MKKILLIVFFLFSVFFLNGCVHRRLTIKSDPPGADIYFDDKLVGKTPLEFDFMWYAKHRIRLEKKEFETLAATENIKSPFFMWIPIDLFSEVMPFPLKDERTLSYKLVSRKDTNTSGEEKKK